MMKTRLQKHCLMLAIACALLVGTAACIIRNQTIGAASCKEKAVVASMIAKQAGYETRIMFGPTLPEYGVSFHVQAEAKINGVWTPLTVNDFYVSVGEQDYWFVAGDVVDISYLIKGD